jgi:hypothetical protein
MWQAIRGQERLTIVFWGYCMVGGIVAIILPFALAEPLYHRGFPMWFFTLLAVLQSLYLLWAHISLWTCAFNSSRRVWGYLARSYVSIVVAVLVVDTLRPFVHTGELEVLQLSSAQQAGASDARNARG